MSPIIHPPFICGSTRRDTN